MKCAAAYEFLGSLYVHAESRTTCGAWIAAPPFYTVGSGNGAPVEGTAVLEAIAASEENISHPGQSEWGTFIRPLLAAAGVESWAAFAESAKCVSVESENGRIRFIPSRNLGPTEGFEPDPDHTIEIAADCTAEAIGESLADAFRRCDSAGHHKD